MALGKGLGAILDEIGQAYENEISFENNSAGQVKEIELHEITPNPYQPRKHFNEEALVELSESIKRYGLLQPIVVIDKGDSYLLVAGERRLRAHQLAGLETIVAIVADVAIDEAKLRELALIENIQREDLNAIELAHSYDELIKVYKITHHDLSEVVSKSRSQITNTLRLLALSEYVQTNLIAGEISQGHAKILVGFDDTEQRALVDTIIAQKLSVRETELIAKSKKNLAQNHKTSKKREFDFMLKQEKNLVGKLPFPIKVRNNTLEIKFKSKKEIEKFLAMLD